MFDLNGDGDVDAEEFAQGAIHKPRGQIFRHF